MEDISEVIISIESKISELSNYQQCRDLDSSTRIARLILDQVDSIQNSDQYNKSVKAKLAYFKGRALAATETYEKGAEENLSKSVKLDPRNGEAWNWLGEVFYLKKDFAQSKRCFEASLEQTGPRKETLRKLSIVYRFLSEAEERKESVLKSIDIAKQALNLDINDSESWYILANAHLTNYFTTNPSFAELEKALKSYAQAEKNTQNSNPDLYFNKSIALNAAGMYNEAFEQLEIADKLDTGLNASQKSQEMLQSIRNVFDMIEKKCNMKKKDINAVCKKIPILLKNSEEWAIVNVSELVEGKNSGKMLSLRVLGYSKSEFPPIFIGCDSKAVFFAVSIYNYPPQSRIVLGCGVFIRDPILKIVSLKGISMALIQVRDPNTLMIHSPS